MSDLPQVPEPARYSTPATPPPYGAYPTAPRTNVLAIISLVAAFVMPVVGVITGHIAMSQIRRTGEQGEGLAKAGLILSYVFIALGILAVIAYIIFFVVLISASEYSNSDF
ncbi:DUF4190 domain-containing protein [Conyzicola sp.]|uniref:DUF4190 domain-containing protein n=1 Tax=Conyzicola sp. TaxID=1969404 RepID=UPI0039891A58